MNAGRAWNWTEQVLVTIAEAGVLAAMWCTLSMIAAVDRLVGNRWEDDL